MLQGIQSISKPVGPTEIPLPQLQPGFNSQWNSLLQENGGGKLSGC